MLDHLDDVASDLSVFHRIDDLTALAGPLFFKLAWRLPAYRGVMREHVMAQQAQTADPARPPASAAGPSRDVDWNPGTRATLMADPALKGIFSFG